MPQPPVASAPARKSVPVRLRALVRRLPRLPGDLDRDLRLLLSVFLVVALVLAAAVAAIRGVENRLLESESTGAAVHWAQFLQTRLRGLDEILVAGLVSEEDRRTLEFASAAGGLRDYQVISPDGIVALSSWSGDFRDTIDPATVLSVVRDERILAQVSEQIVAGERLVIGQAYVPLTSGTDQRGALKVDVDMTHKAMRYRRLGNGALALLIAILVPLGGACGWLIHRNLRERRRSDRLQRQRAQVLEEIAKGADLADVLRRISAFAEQHHKSSRCTIVTLDPAGSHGGAADAGAAADSPESGTLKGRTWSTPLRATSGGLLGSFSLTCATDKDARGAALGPAGALAQLAALAVECRQAESALADMRQRHELILNTAGDGIFGVDAEARIVFANPAAARMLYSDAAAMIGSDSTALVGASDAGRRSCPISATLRDGRGRHVVQIDLRRGDGSEFPADLMVTPARRRASNVHAVVVFHDISTQIQTQQQLLDAKEEAETASRAKSKFLAHMSHELRTPLNAIIGFSEVMARQILGPIENRHYHGYTEDIHASGVHLLSLINDLLDLSKIEAGKLELAEETVDLSTLLKRCTVFVSEPVRTKQLLLDVDVAPDLTAVYCDERKLKQVVVNLLSNAVKFTPPGGRIVLAARREGPDTLHLEVADTGVGIAPEHMAAVMEPFGQADDARGGQPRGTGLGLPLTKGLVELHGGTLVLESEPGVGTTVTIRLPGRAEPPGKARRLRRGGAHGRTAPRSR